MVYICEDETRYTISVQEIEDKNCDLSVSGHSMSLFETLMVSPIEINGATAYEVSSMFSFPCMYCNLEDLPVQNLAPMFTFHRVTAISIAFF
ncbi:hypothetical protein IFM89_034140 [Coptis chinensis]|uniref:Uncharacterized protein n=1 Tax=Coptis chinensis TaxID=261450 RepID=A0A835LY21_9MAGN|nr:hypothetical protein IFM89_034140 [Coptis chinensis]